MSTSSAKRPTRGKGIGNDSSNVPTQQTNSNQNPANALQKPEKRHTKFTDSIYLKIEDTDQPDYMRSFIKKGKEGHGICLLCPIWRPKPEDDPTKKGCELATENIYDHILTGTHEANTLKGDQDKLDKLKKAIEAHRLKKKAKKAPSEKEKKNYLEFIAFCLKENLSFSQLSSIGKYLQEMALDKSVNFLKSHSFDEEELSKVSRCFGTYLLDEIKKDLESTKFSFGLDSSTISGENICALKVRYLQEISESYNSTRTQVKNRIIGIKTLEEKSTGKTYLEIVEEKLLGLGEEIKANFLGITHDAAACLSGQNIGLVGRLKKSLDNYFVDVPDPCHHLNLCLSNSLELVPEKLRNFIDTIHNHFLAPQRKAMLSKIQTKLGNPKLLPRHYVKTRWLSLGESLGRLITIWPSLIEYMKKMTPSSIKRRKKKATTIQKFDYKYYLGLLENEHFYLQIVFLSHFVDELNNTNKALQAPQLDVNKLNEKMKELLLWLSKLVLIPEKMPTDPFELLSIDWKSITIQEELFRRSDSFNEYISTSVNSKLKKLNTLLFTEEDKDFSVLFYPFIANVLKIFCENNILKNEVVQLIDFVDLRGPSHIIEKKILSFNDMFSIFPEAKKPEITKEITKLTTMDLTAERIKAQSSSLHLWDLIKSTNEFVYLPSIFLAAHSLPTSSAPVEQAFSSLKLIRSNIRNRLQEITLQSLMMISEEYKNNNHQERILISDEMLEYYKQAKEDLRFRKSGKKGIFFNLFKFLIKYIEEIKQGDSNIEEVKQDDSNIEEAKQDFSESEPQLQVEQQTLITANRESLKRKSLDDEEILSNNREEADNFSSIKALRSSQLKLLKKSDSSPPQSQNEEPIVVDLGSQTKGNSKKVRYGKKSTIA